MKTKFLLILASATTIVCDNVSAQVPTLELARNATTIGGTTGSGAAPTALIVHPITNFKANLLDTHVHLQWNAETDDNSRSFNIESSRDGLVWQSIGTVMAAGNSNTVNTYRFADVNATVGNNYYRIKAGVVMGDSDYSVVRLVTLEGNFHTSIYPNPVKDKLYITSNGGTIRSIVVFDINGKEMHRYRNLASGNSINMNSLPGGVYFVTIRYTTGHAQTMKVVKE